MSKASDKLQLEFISFIQKLLSEGDFTATYKFALLSSIADICIEKPKGSDNNLITLDEIAEKFIEKYWQHTLPYSETEIVPRILVQNTGHQAAILTELSHYRVKNINTLSQLKSIVAWKSLLAKVKVTICKQPLWKLQIISGQACCFLYPHTASKHEIILNEGIVECFKRFHSLVTSFSQIHWAQKIRELSNNKDIIADKGDLPDFLFGTARLMITPLQPVLFEIQKGQCFYCKERLKNEKGEVDHFIPWARYPNDLGHNFVLAHRRCNNSKKDHLAALYHRDHWFEQNIVNNSALITEQFGRYFVCNSRRSASIASWAYDLAASNHSLLWERGRVFTPFGIDDDDIKDTVERYR